MMKRGATFAVFAALLITPVGCSSQVHPSKQAYADWETWPVSTPADVDFGARFRPFRAVWSREYRNMNGEMRADRVVLVAEELSWYGRRVISVAYHDAGALDSPDTNARTASAYMDRETLALIRATAPVAGTPEDYNVVAVRDDKVVTARVTTATGTAEAKEFRTDGPVFGSIGVDFLIWAGLGLDVDETAVSFLYAPTSNGLTPSIIRVIGADEVELPGGETATAWIVERPIAQPENARMHHFRLLDRPPYLASRHVIDVDTGETSFHLRLLEWELLGG